VLCDVFWPVEDVRDRADGDARFRGNVPDTDRLAYHVHRSIVD
jgi:hypothetical protein